MNKSRTHYAVLNSSVSAIISILKFLIQFISRTFFIHLLGKEYLGVNGLFTSILSMLSLAEMGIGTSIAYSLYKPLANQEYSKVKTLMNLYKKIYRFIGIAVLIIGISILPFLTKLVGEPTIEINVYLAYLLFLGNSVISYFFTYNRSLLSADQKNYITVINDFVFFVLLNLLQVFILILTRNFYLYLAVNILTTFLGNVYLSKKVDKEYSMLKNTPEIPLDAETKSILKKNTLGNFTGKIGSMIVSSTDNIYISAFVNISTVGLYSNYLLIINGLQTFTMQLISSVTGSIGNLGSYSENKKLYVVFKRHNFLNFVIIFFATPIMVSMINPFIEIWAGSSYRLPIITTLLIIINYAIKAYRLSCWVFIDALGLAWQVKWKSFWEGIVNILASGLFLLYFKLGINGVLLGTTLSSILVVSWWEPYAVFKFGIKQKFRNYIYQSTYYFLTLFITCVFTYYSNNFLLVVNIRNELFAFILKLLLTFILTLGFFLIFYRKNENFEYFVSIAKNKIYRKENN